MTGDEETCLVHVLKAEPMYITLKHPGIVLLDNFYAGTQPVNRILPKGTEVTFVTP